MKYEKITLDATDKNILESIKEDKFGRSADIKSFIEGLDMIDTNMFISLDARWGEGKTFFIRQIEKTLEYLSKKRFSQNIDEIKDYFIDSDLSNIKLNKIYLPIYYNAWLYDCHKDPLMSLLYVLIKERGKYISAKMNSEKIRDNLLSIVSSFSLVLPFIEINFENFKDNKKKICWKKYGLLKILVKL